MASSSKYAGARIGRFFGHCFRFCCGWWRPGALSVRSPDWWNVAFPKFFLTESWILRYVQSCNSRTGGVVSFREVSTEAPSIGSCSYKFVWAENIQMESDLGKPRWSQGIFPRSLFVSVKILQTKRLTRRTVCKCIRQHPSCAKFKIHHIKEINPALGNEGYEVGKVSHILARRGCIHCSLVMASEPVELGSTDGLTEANLSSSVGESNLQGKKLCAHDDFLSDKGARY